MRSVIPPVEARAASHLSSGRVGACASAVLIVATAVGLTTAPGALDLAPQDDVRPKPKPPPYPFPTTLPKPKPPKLPTPPEPRP